MKNCNLLYFITDGTLADPGTYDELIDKSFEFKTMVTAVVV